MEFSTQRSLVCGRGARYYEHTEESESCTSSNFVRWYREESEEVEMQTGLVLSRIMNR